LIYLLWLENGGYYKILKIGAWGILDGLNGPKTKLSKVSRLKVMP